MTNIKAPEIKSKYLERFKKLAAIPGARLTGTRILIEPIELGEIKSESGLILASPESHGRGTFQTHMAHFAVVLMLGDAVKDEMPELEVGNIVLLSEYGCRSYTTFPGLLTYVEGDLQLSASSEVHLVYKDQETFNAAVKALNETA